MGITTEASHLLKKFALVILIEHGLS